MASDEQLPHAWLQAFDGTGLAAKQAVSAILATVDEDGWPHLSFLGVGEILARDAGRLALLLWPTSTTARNVARAGRATLFGEAEGNVWEVRLDVTPEEDGVDGPSRFEARVVAVRRHAAPYADVTGMIGFRLHDPEGTVERWQRQVERLAGRT